MKIGANTINYVLLEGACMDLTGFLMIKYDVRANLTAKVVLR